MVVSAPALQGLRRMSIKSPAPILEDDYFVPTYSPGGARKKLGSLPETLISSVKLQRRFISVTSRL
jgi:hypothetical protein